MSPPPILLITMGDVAGIGPEIIVSAWPQLTGLCRPAVVGDESWLRRAVALADTGARVQPISRPEDADASAAIIPCLASSPVELSAVQVGHLSAAGGRAAYEFLCTAIDHTLSGAAQGIVTCPLNKEGLRAAGLPFPGHTEILAERTGTPEVAMMLFRKGLGVIHVTLHMALRDVFVCLTPEAIEEKTRLLHGIMPRLIDRPARIGVAALNPHASDGGLFGDEEEAIIRPAVAKSREQGVDVSGPWPSDTLFARASAGEFDGIVAMYHDQGHIAIKLLGGREAVNVSVGLPIVRTSVAHGTAYDIAGKGIADPSSLVEATRLAAKLAQSK